MIRPSETKGYVWDTTSGTPLDEVEVIVSTGTRVCLLAFVFSADTTQYTSAWSNNNFSSLPRIEFRNGSSADSATVRFGSLAHVTQDIQSLASADFGVSNSSVNFPGRGVFFEDGMSVRIQIPNPSSSCVCRISFNVVYEF